MTSDALAQPANRLPLALKLVYTAFMAVLVPVYWHYYGPTNFLYFCDVALFLTAAQSGPGPHAGEHQLRLGPER
jgi:hypothetical protein